MKIFLVEDNKELNELITETFEEIGYFVVSCKDGQEAFKHVDEFFDLYLIDINLPNVNGLELVKKVQSSQNNSKIFIISGDNNIDTILKAYDLGCNDYIKKPFDLREVMAKINIVFRDKLNSHIKLTDECYYDKKLKLVYHKQKPVKLTKKESILLDTLINNMGKIVSNQTIEEAVWGKENSNGHTRQLISKLKKALPCNEIIQNFSSNGYMVDNI